jgi:hypothetical protein
MAQTNTPSESPTQDGTECALTKPYRVVYFLSPGDPGGMAERTKATVLKTVVAERSPWVRIPLPPLDRHHQVERLPW